MKTFKRFRDIVNANVNASLTSWKIRRRLIRFMLSEMEETLRGKKCCCERLETRDRRGRDQPHEGFLSRWETGHGSQSKRIAMTGSRGACREEPGGEAFGRA